MSVEYQKTQLSYGGYRPGRVIWIKLLNGQKVVKFNLLDQVGNVLFSAERKSNDEEIIEDNITYETITEEQKKDIRKVLARIEPYYNWYDEELEDVLSYFGNEIVRLDDLVRHTRRYNEILVDYDIYSSYEEAEDVNEINNLFGIDYHEVGTITRAAIENNLIQKLLKHQKWDMIEMNIIENGQIDSYLLEFEKREE